MTSGNFWDMFGIPAFVVGACLYYYYRVTICGEIELLRGKDKEPLSLDKSKAYAKEAGRLLIGFALGAVLMGLISMVSSGAALIEGVVVTAIEIYCWKKMNVKYERR